MMASALAVRTARAYPSASASRHCGSTALRSAAPASRRIGSHIVRTGTPSIGTRLLLLWILVLRRCFILASFSRPLSRLEELVSMGLTVDKPDPDDFL